MGMKAVDIEAIIEGGTWSSESEYIISCPYCDDGSSHNHCYINVQKRLFFCQKCSESGLLSSLLEYMGLTAAAAEIRYNRVKTGDSASPVTRALIDYSIFPKVGTSGSVNDSLAQLYLQRRGFDEDELELYDIRFSEKARFYGRVIFPITENDDIVCMSARAYLPAVSPKYLFPHKGESLLTADKVLYGIDLLKPEDDIFLVEGVIDAISLIRKLPKNMWALSLMSKRMSFTQMEKLLLLGKGRIFWMMLDADANKESVLIAKKLFVRERKVRVCKLSEEAHDPDMATITEVEDVIAKADIFDNEYYDKWKVESRT